MNYWLDTKKRFWAQKSGMIGSFVLGLFFLIALYAPFLASSKPIALHYNGEWYFPLFRYYFSSIYYSKGIDLFFNILGALFPLYLLSGLIWKKGRGIALMVLMGAALALFVLFGFFIKIDPANDKELTIARKEKWDQVQSRQNQAPGHIREPYPFPNFAFELKYLNGYAKINLVLDHYLAKREHERLTEALREKGDSEPLYTLYTVSTDHDKERTTDLESELKRYLPEYAQSRKEEEEGKNVAQKNQRIEKMKNSLQYIQDKERWLQEQESKITFILMSFIRPHDWQEDTGGSQAMNLRLSFIDLSRINRQDLMAALIFGARISFFVGMFATILSLLIGIPLGLVSGFYGGRVDMALCRLIEVWESMPAFFMLLLIVTLMQTKSLFLIISVIAIFSWTGVFRFVRAESLRQRALLYIDSCHALGFSDRRILFIHLLPNSIVPVVALLPFDMMSAITREAGLSFLGLGEEQSCSWGALMDEGRAAFPAESALLWPPAIALTLLLIAIALVGDALHNAMDPKGS